MMRRRSFSGLQTAKVGAAAEAAGRQGTLRPRPRSSSPPPLLMIPPGVVVGEDDDGEVAERSSVDYHHFFNPVEKKVIRIKKKFMLSWERELHSPDDALCFGSSHGWLAFVHPRNCGIYLFNPLHSSSSCSPLPFIVPLPSIETLPSILGVRVHKSDKRISSSPLTTYLIDPEIEGHPEYDQSPEKLSSLIIRKLVLSSTPSHPCCAVMAIEGRSCELLFSKPWDTAWTVLDRKSLRGLPFYPYEDLIFSNKDHRFYAVDAETYSIEAWDLSDPSSPKKELMEPLWSGRWHEASEQILRDEYCSEKKYLVECSTSGDLLLVIRFVAVEVAEDGTLLPCIKDDDVGDPFVLEIDAYPPENTYPPYATQRFDVYKLDLVENEWVSVECLGEQALFLGLNHSFALSTCDFPELRGNSIYFTDDFWDGMRSEYCSNRGQDSGVYDIETDRITPFYSSALPFVQPPVWVFPNPL